MSERECPEMANTYDEVLRGCYELYKADWKKTHVTPEEEAAERKAYEEEVGFDPDTLACYPTFDAWVEEHGYGGNLYAGLAECERTEFVDKDYMEHLFDGMEGCRYTAWLDVVQC